MAAHQLEPTVEDLKALRESMIEKMRQGAYGNPVTDNFPWVIYAQTVAAYLNFHAHERIPVDLYLPSLATKPPIP